MTPDALFETTITDERTDGRTDGRTDIAISRVAFATEKQAHHAEVAKQRVLEKRLI